jgi:signal transduction histidine kinase
MPEGGILKIVARPCMKNEIEGIEIMIKDTGCGIEHQSIPKIFEPFYTTRDMGTGLGLAVVNRILEGYNGMIDIQSVMGKGTTCMIWFPSNIIPSDKNEIH